MSKCGFEPIFDENCNILILGSFPSVKSRAERFYYGNKQNRFWKTLSSAFDEQLPISIEEKIAFVLHHNIALWDIVQSCEIEGSLDTAIKYPQIADIQSLINKAPIKQIICNGKTAYSLFIKNFKNLSHLALCLPSTSPANTRFDESLWFDALQ